MNYSHIFGFGELLLCGAQFYGAWNVGRIGGQPLFLLRVSTFGTPTLVLWERVLDAELIPRWLHDTCLGDTFHTVVERMISPNESSKAPLCVRDSVLMPADCSITVTEGAFTHLAQVLEAMLHAGRFAPSVRFSDGVVAPSEMSKLLRGQDLGER